MLIEGEIHTTPIRYDVYRQYLSFCCCYIVLLDGAAAAAAAAEEALYIFLSERAEIHIMTAAATAGSQLLVYTALINSLLCEEETVIIATPSKTPV